jgi:ferric-dicitrate binding protein FerR (iron transport regulator)
MTSPLLRKLVREAREDLGTQEAGGVDWTRVDASLFERIKQERASASEIATSTRRWSWPVLALAATAAASVGFAVGIRGALERAHSPTAETALEGAANVVSIEEGGRILVNGRAARSGATLRLGDVIEAQGGPATLQGVGKLTMRLEGGARAKVTQVRQPVAVALERGALEARVVHVAHGDAFVVELDGARVAVHGTHLRVAREGARVTVDLSEGIVSIDDVRRMGSSASGTLMVAPAHAEFVVTQPLETLTVTREVAALRTPIELASAAPSPPAARESGTQTPALQALEPRLRDPRESTRGGPRALEAPGTEAEGRVPRPEGPPMPNAEGHPTAGATAAAGPGPQPKEGVGEAEIAKAIRACMADRPRPENVTISVTTTLYLTLAEDGSVRTARFDPPVAPDVNECAAAVIYKSHFVHGGNATVQVDFKN